MLLDCARKILLTLGPICVPLGVAGWRKYKSNFNRIKSLYHACRKLRHSTSKKEEKRFEAEFKSIEAVRAYLDACRPVIGMAKEALGDIPVGTYAREREIEDIKKYIDYAVKFVSQIERRIILDETIPHDEKVFSIFEPHTEWISKGKAGVPVELGVKVCVLEDQYGFVLASRVMAGENDVDVAVPILKAALKEFPNIASCSYDKGFWSRNNYYEITELGIFGVMRKKGKATAEERERENSPEFVELRRKHSAVESGINALENHGLDRCPDSGLDGLKRYVGFAVLGRNLQKLGAILRQQKLEEQQRRRKALKWSPTATAA